MTISDMLNFKDIYPILADIKFSFQTVYKLSKISKALEKEFEFYQEKFNELLDSYALKDENNNYIITEDGKSIKIQPEKITECAEKMAELYNVTIANPPEYLNIEELQDLNLTLSEMNKLMPFIK